MDNLNNGRHGWLRLTPAYSARFVEERLKDYPSTLSVLDPFGGTGTTALIAGYLGFSATTTELNPFLVWFARAKTRFYTEEQLTRARVLAHTLTRKAVISAEEAEPPPIHDIGRWWSTDSLRWLSGLRRTLASQINEEEHTIDLLRVAFARCVIDLSNASYHHPSVSFRESAQLQLDFEDYNTLFHRHLEFVLRGASHNPRCSAQVFQDDARVLSSLPTKTYDLVITSPPYVNRISYIRELRPYMYWLGYLRNGREAGELDWQAIGGTWGTATSRLKSWEPQLPVDSEVEAIATRILNAHPANGILMANYVLKYFEDMRLHIGNLTRVLRRDARIHYVVGNSSFYGILVPVEQILARLFAQQGFEEVRIACLRKRNCKRELYEYEITGVYRGA